MSCYLTALPKSFCRFFFQDRNKEKISGDQEEEKTKKVADITFSSQYPGLTNYITSIISLPHCYTVLSCKKYYDRETKNEAWVRFFQSLIGITTAFFNTANLVHILSTKGICMDIFIFSTLFIILSIPIVLIELSICIYYLYKQRTFYKDPLFEIHDILIKSYTEITLEDKNRLINFINKNQQLLNERIGETKKSTIQNLLTDQNLSNDEEKLKFQYLAQCLFIEQFKKAHLELSFEEQQQNEKLSNSPIEITNQKKLLLAKRIFPQLRDYIARINYMPDNYLEIDSANMQKQVIEAKKIILEINSKRKSKHYLLIVKIVVASLILITSILALTGCPVACIPLVILILAHVIDVSHWILENRLSKCDIESKLQKKE